MLSKRNGSFKKMTTSYGSMLPIGFNVINMEELSI